MPYSTYQLVASPPGSTFPVTAAVVAPTDVGAPVTALGAFAAAGATMTRASDASAATAIAGLMPASLSPSR